MSRPHVLAGTDRRYGSSRSRSPNASKRPPGVRPQSQRRTAARLLTVTLQYNIFSMSNDNVWAGTPVDTFCDSNDPDGPTHSYVSYNDYYNEPSPSRNFPYDIGDTSVAETPQFESTPPQGPQDLVAQDPDIMSQDPGWGSQVLNPRNGDDGGANADEDLPQPDPTDAFALARDEPDMDTLMAWDSTSASGDGGTGDANLPDYIPTADSTQLGEGEAGDNSELQSWAPASNAEVYGSSGSYTAPNVELCPEPDYLDDYGAAGYGDSSCPAGSAWPSSVKGTLRTKHPPSGHAPAQDEYFYFDLCGPGSATFILHTYIPNYVDGYNGDGHFRSAGRGWYQFLYHVAYGLMYWSWPSYNASGGTAGWQTRWGNEMHVLNAFMKLRRVGKRFIWKKVFDPANKGESAYAKKHPSEVLTEQGLKVAIKRDMQPNRRADWGTQRDVAMPRGALFAAVDAYRLAGWGTNHVNHYVGVYGYTQDIDNSGKPGLKYADTAYQYDSPDHTSSNLTYGRHDVQVDQFWGAIKTTTKTDGVYNSDRAVVY